LLRRFRASWRLFRRLWVSGRLFRRLWAPGRLLRRQLGLMEILLALGLSGRFSTPWLRPV
jgi:hypothetical protein